MQTCLILLRRPPQSQPEISISSNDLLHLQYVTFDTLTTALRRLHPAKHHTFLARVLTIIMDLDDLNTLPLVTLAELLFGLIDRCTDPRAILNIQNCLIHICLMLTEATC